MCSLKFQSGLEQRNVNVQRGGGNALKVEGGGRAEKYVHIRRAEGGVLTEVSLLLSRCVRSAGAEKITIPTTSNRRTTSHPASRAPEDPPRPAGWKPFPGSPRSPIMPVVVNHSSPLLWVRLAALVFSCIAFSVAAHGARLSDRTGDWCIFCWSFSFAGTLLVLLVELFGLQSRALVSWKNFPITFACYASLLCLSASIIFPLYFLKGNPVRGETRDFRIVSTVFSCLATIAYMSEVSICKARPGEVAGYMATAPGLLKVCETFVACVIFVFISNPVSYDSNGALKWCMAVYCICFILSAAIIVLCVGECTGYLPFPFARFLSAYALLAVLMYLSATIIWPIFQFDKKHGGIDRRPSNCNQYSGLCDYDKLVAVAVLTGLNFILYLADLVYSARLVFVTV
ncbi:myeloid-associated differentiation marker [Arapaima gigas]